MGVKNKKWGKSVMKSLIIYASKKGAAEKCAEQIKRGITGEVKIITFKEAQDLPLDSYDNIIIGSSVYAGRLDKNLKTFCQSHEELLKKKKTFLFLVCMSDKLIDNYVRDNIPKEVAEHLTDVVYCGGALYFSKMNFFEKFIMKKIANSEMKAKGESHKIDGKTDIETFNKANMSTLCRKINQN